MEVILKHIGTGNIGRYVEKRNGYYGEVTIILLSDGRQYFAPSIEFVPASDIEKVFAYPMHTEPFVPEIIPKGETKPPLKNNSTD